MKMKAWTKSCRRPMKNSCRWLQTPNKLEFDGLVKIIVVCTRVILEVSVGGTHSRVVSVYFELLGNQCSPLMASRLSSFFSDCGVDFVPNCAKRHYTLFFNQTVEVLTQMLTYRVGLCVLLSTFSIVLAYVVYFLRGELLTFLRINAVKTSKRSFELVTYCVGVIFIL